MPTDPHVAQLLLEVGDAGSDAVFEFDLPRSTTGGYFIASFVSIPSGHLAYNISSTSFIAGLEALSNIGAGNIDVIGARLGPYRIRFQNALGLQALPIETFPFTIDGANLTPAASIVVRQLSIGKAPVLLAQATSIFTTYSLDYPQYPRLAFLYAKRDLINILLGTAQQFVDTNVNAGERKESQQFRNLKDLLGIVETEIDNILSPTTPSAPASTESLRVQTGVITKRTPNGLPYGSTAHGCGKVFRPHPL